MVAKFSFVSAALRSRLPFAALPSRRGALASVLTLAAVCLGGSSSWAQAPIALPSTFSTVAGGASTSGGAITGGVLPAKGAACSTGSPYVATDAFGDGCPGINTAMSGDFRGGLQVDGQGNVFIMDSTNAIVRKIDAKSGLVTAVTGTSIGSCTTSSDGYGDGCPLAQTKLSTARGINIDPYGNVFIAGYGMQTINILCNAISPLCPNTANHKQVGYTYRIAGCVASATAAGTSGSGTTNGTSGDGYVATPYGNLSGDVADWGAGSTTYGSCTPAATLGAVSSPRGVAADKYGNVYIAETGTTGNGYRYRVVVGPATFTLPNGTVLTNPMAGIIALDPAYSSITPASAYGKIYPLVGGFTAAVTGVTPPTAIGTACAGNSGGTTLDKLGDGCPFYETTSGTGQQGVGTDADGNVIFADNSESIVRVLYVGGTTMAAAIRAANANPALTITPGYVYPIIGAINSLATNSTLSATPSLGTTTTIGNGTSKVAIDPNGNIYISDFNQIAVLFFDIKTGYVRKLISSGTSLCASKLDSVGDGCPVGQASFGSASAGIGIGLNPQGDLYLGDDSNLLIRKVTASNLVTIPLGTTLTETVTLHGAAGTTGITVLPTTSSPDVTITPSAVTCGAANADGTLDCTIPVTFTPSAPGTRGTEMYVAAQGVTGSSVLPVAGIANGSALAVDSSAPTVTSAGGVSTPVSLAVDGSSDVFTISTGSGVFVELSNGSSQPITATLPTNPYQIAVDSKGDIYATGTGSSTITKLTPTGTGTYTQSSISYTPTTSPAAPYGIAVDRQGNLFVADHTNQAVYELPVGDTFEYLNEPTIVATGFTGIGQLALDGGGNLFIADPGAGVVKKLLAGATSTTTVASSVNPTYIAADTAGDLYVQDASAKTVTEYPLSGAASSVVYSFTGNAAGIAVDGNGVVYETETALGQVNAIQRQNAAYNFGTSITATFAGTLTDVGNTAATSANQTDTGDFQVVAGATSGCNLAATLLSGSACTVSATFTPQSGSGVVSDVVSLLPATSTVGKLTLTATKNGSAVTTMTTISAETPASPVYVASGTEVSFTIGVSASAGTASGSVAVTIDTNLPVNYNLGANGTVVVPLSGLTAGSHTISATYATQNGFTGSASTTTNFSVAQAVTTLSWTPTATTQQFSAAIGTGVLDATATSGGVAVPGNVIYTATPSGGSASAIQSASFLPIGTYTLNATFVPNDSLDFSTASGSVTSYSVTKATTTAPVGASQMLVAADGSGNYTSVQAAVNALGANGGSIYIKPGTYTGDVAIVQPNVALRGLGGDPTQVVITHASGSFGGSGTYAYAGEFTPSITNGSQLPLGSTLFTGDEGSATLVVAKGVNTAFSTATLTPNNFFADTLSLVNTYDTDNVTTTTTQVVSGQCTANAGPAMTYFALYNAGTECASQALAIWTTADLAVMNNVYTTSLQDTIYAGSQGAGANGYVPARQYWFRGKVTGDVDYIFGDAAVAFDYSTIYTVFHGTTATGTETIEAQNKMHQTNGTGDYLSGYVMNSNVFTSQAPGMTQLYFGRPYGPYSTWIMLNSYVDQVNALGYIEFSGDTNLPTSTYAEYNNIPYTDPNPGSADSNGIIYLGSGGNTGSGVTGTRETTSQDPGTLEASNTVKTSLTQAQAQQYFPTNFLSQTVPSAVSSTANWNPTAALSANVNAFVPSGSSATVVAGTPVTLLMRPQTPGLGAITNGSYTIPTGTYTLTDTVNGTPKVLASGNLDASGEAYFVSSSLAAGAHNLTWTYSGDSNFSGSSTTSAYVLTVVGNTTTTTLALTTSPITYGQAATVTATVAPAGGSISPTGTVTLTIDGATTQMATLSGGMATFTVSGLSGGSHSFTASYGGSTTFQSSATTSSTGLTVNPATLTATASCSNRVYGQVNTCSLSVTGYQYTDSAATVFTGTPAATTTATRSSAAGMYAATAVTSSLAETTAGSADYTVNPVSTNFSITGGAAQQILFAPLPAFPHGGSYQLTARTTSGLPVTYTVTAGNGIASVSGTTLTVTGTGTTVTVQASQTTDPTGDYAPATAVSQSFTPQ